MMKTIFKSKDIFMFFVYFLKVNSMLFAMVKNVFKSKD